MAVEKTKIYLSNHLQQGLADGYTWIRAASYIINRHGNDLPSSISKIYTLSKEINVVKNRRLY